MMNWISRVLVVTGVCVMTSVVGERPSPRNNHLPRRRTRTPSSSFRA